MEQYEMVALIRGGIAQPGGAWADLGAGTGNFTWALAELLGAEATIYAIDRDQRAITAQRQRILHDPPAASVVPRQADVLQSLSLPPLDGILAANLLHFLRDQRQALHQILRMLKPHGNVVIVEYEQQRPIPWVPYPLPFARLEEVALQAGFRQITLIGRRVSPSSGRELYAALLRSDCD